MKPVVRIAAATAMIAIGVLHFVSPAPFVKIVPSFLPAPRLLVFVSGFFEILGGVGLLVPVARIRRAAAIGLIALYIAVFPANINMAVNDVQPTAHHIPTPLLWLRLPFQAGLIALAWWLRE